MGDLIAAEYFIDTDPGVGNGSALAVAPAGPAINQIFPIDLTGVSSGTHKLFIRVKDSNEIWSEAHAENFEILACTAPVAPTVPSVTQCNSGTVTLNATAGITGSQVYKWYENASTTMYFLPVPLLPPPL